MEDMKLFDSNVSDEQAEALQAIQDLGVDTYGNQQIVRTLVELYNRGMLDKANEAYQSYVSGIDGFYDNQKRDIILGVLVNPVDEYLNSNPSNKDLTAFIRLEYNTKLFVLEYPYEVEDLDGLKQLENTGFFKSMSNTANLLFLNHYDFEELKQKQFDQSRVNNVIELLLHTIEQFNVTPKLDNVLFAAKNLNEKQARIIDLLSYTGFTLDDLIEMFEWNSLLTILEKVYEIQQYKTTVSVEECAFLVHFMYQRYPEISPSNFRVLSTNAVYVDALFEETLNICSAEIKSVINSIRALESINSFEFVLNGVTSLLLPIDAGMEYYTRVQVKDLFANAVSLIYETAPNDKLILYINTTVNGDLYTSGDRSFSPSLLFDYNSCEDEYDLNGLMDLLFDEMANSTLLFDLRMKAYFKQTFSPWEDRYNLYKEQSVEVRYAMYLTVLSIQNGHSDYESILRRNDLGIPFIKLLKTFIRPDDSFYSAVARYHCAVIKLPFNFYNKAFNITEQNIVFDNKEYNLLGIFSGNKDLLIAMKDFPGSQIMEEFGVVA